ncbi:MCE family protein [Mycobacterium sp. NPDC003449]
MQRRSLTATLRRLTVFALVCGIGMFTLFAVFGQLRFSNQKTYDALFSSVSGLKGGNFVRIAGVEVGKVTKIVIDDDASARVTFTADDTVMLTEGSRAVIRYDDLIGGRYLALEEGAGGTKRLAYGATIPLDHTAPALDLDALLGGFRPLFRALDPEQVNALSGQLIAAFQGQGPTVGSVLDQTATLTSTLADRDELIGQVIANLSTVLGSFGDRSDKLASAVDSLSQLMHGLQQRRDDISNAVAYGDAAASSIATLLAQARPALQETVHQTDRAAGVVLSDHDYFDNLLATLPDTYRTLNRQALYGDFFSFYICDLALKVNGKGGQPTYVKIAGQDTGRCTPR